MATVGGSTLKASLSSTLLMRPAIHQRTHSNSSAASYASSSPLDSPVSEDQFAFSACGTPSDEQPPSRAHNITSAPRHDPLFDDYYNEEDRRSKSTSRVREPSESSHLISRSKPIAIDLPSARKQSLASVDTPPEPLSARGDIPGGFFPFHEDPTSRVRKPHPFHVDATKARRQSIHQASEHAKSASASNYSAAPDMAAPSKNSLMGSVGRMTSSSHTPVSSYLPIGVYDNAALPMGKYYPSNYENRPGKSSPQRVQPFIKVSPAPAVRSESQSVRRGDSGHKRSKSDVQRKLMQYQRDMIAQASIAANAVLNQNNTTGSGSGDQSLLTPAGVSLKHLQLGGKMIKSHKPLSPRLKPMGSPGPVTPMELESGGSDSYLTLGKPLTGLDAERQAAEVSRAVRAEEARQLRQDLHSPVEK
ncbi:hypothetical protein B0T19DRAFT_77984 [Cercophora scortea]|uniref:Uncharacterized protein n=1 Tax=Cercophora scortea TaxID=314031 RepID=A0AAE0J5X7_9PEZI|nr:hypothetical protein B0T19DRAFT_77984 [Cercophora scortea]